MIDLDSVVPTAAALVAVEGHQELPHQETAVADHLAARLRAVGATVTTPPVPGGRRNVIARVHGGRPGPRLMFNGHLDTVPPYGMPDALRPTIEKGRLWGRGAVDMKGALAAMAAVVEALAAPGADFAGELVLTAVAGEENGSPGMLAMVEPGAAHIGTDIAADFAVVGEPTMMRVARAHKGAMWAEAVFAGVAAHGSVPEQGVNAIAHAARFVTAVGRDLAPALRERHHPLLGPATVNVGVITGGDRPPMVPAECRVQLDRRWLPGERHADVLAELAALASADEAARATVAEMDGTGTFVHAPLDCPADNVHLRALCEVVAAEGLPAAPIGVQFWTDGALLASRTGTPTVVCGPGDIAQAHSLAEWVAVDQLRLAASVYFGFAARILSVRTA